MKWWNQSWNPVVGCTHAGSPGCDHCYARTLHEQRRKAYLAGKRVPECYARPFDEVRCLADRLRMPLRWRKPRVVFVNSMSDLFHPDVPDHFIDQAFAVMGLARDHKFIVCTKRVKRMREYMLRPSQPDRGRDGKPAGWFTHNGAWPGGFEGLNRKGEEPGVILGSEWPLSNVMGVVSVCNQAEAEANVPELLKADLALRGVNIGPALGAVDLRRISVGVRAEGEYLDALEGVEYLGDAAFNVSALDWVGWEGESGPKARPAHPDWARLARDRCREGGVPFFFKQWGEWVAWDDENWSLPSGADDVLAHEAARTIDGVEYLRIGQRRTGRKLDEMEHNGMPEGWVL